MAVRIRLRREGRKKSPAYRIVVTESTMPRDGRFIEIIGTYQPRLSEKALTLKADRAGGPMSVIFISARGQTKDKVQAFKLGADDYLVKPFDPAELAARVQVGLRVVHLQHTLSARVDELEQALTRVHGLEQLLPICAHCKRIRAGDGGWETLEGFLGSNAGVRFSHGACPGCASKWVDEADAVTPQG